MFSGNWRYHLALGWLAPFLILFGYAVAFLVSGGDLLHCKKANPESSNAASQPKPVAIPEPIKNERDCRDSSSQRDEKCQSWRQAEAAEEQACVARRQFYAGAIGLFLLFFTLLANAVAGWGAKEAADVARDTLIASNRAWIKRTRVYFATSLDFGPDGRVHSSVAYEFVNRGNAPALHIQMAACLLSIDNGHVPERRARQFFEEERRKPIYGGFALFPKERYPRPRDRRVLDGVHLTKEEADRATDNAGRMTLFLAACISYTFASDPKKLHQTSCLFEVTTKQPFIIRNGPRIPETDLGLEETGILSMDIVD